MTSLTTGAAPATKPVLGRVREPHRVAIVQDWGTGMQPLYDQYDATRLAFEEAYESGLLDRPVEIEVLEVEGLPYARFSTLLHAVEDLVRDFDPLVLIGPHTSENGPALKPYVEQWGIPLVLQSGALSAAGPWTFLTQNGTFSDEAIMMVNHVVDVWGDRTLGIIREDNLLGDEYAQYLRAHAKRRGLKLVSDVLVGSFIEAEDAREAFRTLRAAGAQSCAYVGFGASAFQILGASQQAVAEGYDLHRITMSIYMGTIEGLTGATGDVYGGMMQNYEGWTGVDQFDERNAVFTDMLDRFAARFDGRRPVHCYTAQGFDLGNVVAHALATARPFTRDGVRRAFETVRMVPAAVGGPGTVLSYGPWDHRGYKGDYIVLRQVEGGRNVLAHG